MNQIRRQRLEKRILRLVADLYFQELKDPNLGFATFTRVELSNDASSASIFVSIYEEKKAQEETLAALQRASGFIRGRIAKVVRMKNIPVVTFILDDSLEKAEKIENLISGHDQTESR